MTSDLIAAAVGLTLAACAVSPVLTQELELPEATALIPEIAVETADGNSSAAQSLADNRDGIAWRPVFRESLVFLTIQHISRFSEARTANRLGGPFLKDWIDSVHSLNRFNDGGKIMTNWVAHPMMGSVSAHILGQNDPAYLSRKIGSGNGYWRAKGKQFLFATAYSLQFEIGPLSESSLGNIHQGGIDLALTSSLGTLWSVGEDLAAQRVVSPIRANHPKWANALTIFLNPTRAVANLMAFKSPWTCEAASCR